MKLLTIGFTKKSAEAFFTKRKKHKGTWEAYERAFLELMASRKIEEEFKPALFDDACLLCSEHEPYHKSGSFTCVGQ